MKYRFCLMLLFAGCTSFTYAETLQGLGDAVWGIPAARPIYRVLPRVDSHGQTVPATPAPAYQIRPMQPYAYGWFGAQPSPHWSRRIGTMGNYTQWTLK